jgi:2-polyprenyl-6-methoxyphenol hydroxylase-like FAD-dependent oxidoreductase
MRVAVVGGGIAGLTFASRLASLGLGCTVYEQEPTPEEGYGIQLAPNGVRLLRRAGVRELRAVVPERVRIRRWDDGRDLSTTPLGQACADRFGAPYLTLPRSELLAALHRAVARRGEVQLRYGARCVRVDAGSLHLADGSSVAADLVVGADGLHSVVRRALSPDQVRDSGITVHRGLVRRGWTDGVPEVCVWLGPGRHLAAYPVDRDRYSFVAATADPAGGLVDAYEGWDPEVRDLLAGAESVTRWELRDRTPLRTWHTGSVTVIGDAAHAMLPLGAHGANQAIESAAALAVTVAGSSRSSLTTNLDRYAGVRAERIGRVMELVRHNAADHHLADGPAQRGRDEALRRQQSLATRAWLYGYDVEAMLSAALAGRAVRAT